MANQFESSLRDFVQSNKEKSASKTSLLGTDLSNSQWSLFSKQSADDTATADEHYDSGGMDVWFSDAKRDPCLPALTKKQRILGFMMCLIMGVFCFTLSSFYIPVLIIKARKFALLYTLGSMFFIMSFAALWGPWNHIKHLFSGQRLPFTVVYFATIFATIYFAMVKRSYVFTILCAVVQIVSLVWYIISYIPGGQTGLKFFSKIFYAATARTASSILPV